MKNIVISADNIRKIFSVPDEVADNLEKHCLQFCKWLKNSPEAEKYRKGGVMYYDEGDFIEYLNTRIFPQQKSTFVEELDWEIYGPDKPSPHPEFNF